MSYADLSIAVREIAERELTDKQFEVFKLEQDGWGTMPIARRLSLTRSAVRDRLHNAHTKLEHFGVVQNVNGYWSTEEVAA